MILTATSFWAANTSLLWAPGVPLGLAVLAIAQMGVHLVFFLHITTGSDNTNNVLALAFGMLIVTLVDRRLAVDHGQFERQHDAIARVAEFAYAALNGFSDDNTRTRIRIVALSARFKNAPSALKAAGRLGRQQIEPWTRETRWIDLQERAGA